MAAVPDKSNQHDYDTDYYSWALEQAALLRAGRFDKLDLANLIEEVEDLGNRHRDALRSAYKQLLAHLLKYKYQPSHRTSSWEISIKKQRLEIADVLGDNPGLQSKNDDAFAIGYQRARKLAAVETGLPLATFPEHCEWPLAQVLDDDWLPGD